MVTLGITITAATVAIVVVSFLARRTRPLPWHGWFGLIALASAEWMMFHGVEPVATFFTPVAWTAYLLIADAALFAVRGRSYLRNAPLEFARMAFLSIPLWLIFEGYNLRLQNWTYVGVPSNLLLRWFGYCWSFATITPGILITAELVESLSWVPRRAKAFHLSRATEAAFIVVGALLLAAPLVLPRNIAPYLFAFVWIGFVFLLDPILKHRDGPSFLADLEHGDRARLFSVLVSGWVCGWLWEFWNFWAAAKWRYTFPMFQDWKIFEMPVPGFLGFMPFALECFLLYALTSALLAWKPTPMRETIGTVHSNAEATSSTVTASHRDAAR